MGAFATYTNDYEEEWHCSKRCSPPLRCTRCADIIDDWLAATNYICGGIGVSHDHDRAGYPISDGFQSNPKHVPPQQQQQQQNLQTLCQQKEKKTTPASDYTQQAMSVDQDRFYASHGVLQLHVKQLPSHILYIILYCKCVCVCVYSSTP